MDTRLAIFFPFSRRRKKTRTENKKEEDRKNSNHHTMMMCKCKNLNCNVIFLLKKLFIDMFFITSNTEAHLNFPFFSEKN
jgi:hypothetical protein